MSKSEVNIWGVGHERYLCWCLQNARHQLDENFEEIRNFPSETAKLYVEFCESLGTEERWTFIEGRIFRGVMPDLYEAIHDDLWQRADRFILKQRGKTAMARSRQRGAIGSKLMRLLENSWSADLFGQMTLKRSDQIRAQMEDRGWRLDTSLTFDKRLLHFYKLYDPKGHVQLEKSSFLSWLGSGVSPWKDARRGSEAEIAEQVIQLLTKYSKKFLHHFSRQAEPGSATG